MSVTVVCLNKTNRLGAEYQEDGHWRKRLHKFWHRVLVEGRQNEGGDDKELENSEAECADDELEVHDGIALHVQASYAKEAEPTQLQQRDNENRVTRSKECLSHTSQSKCRCNNANRRAPDVQGEVMMTNSAEYGHAIHE